MQPNPVPVSSGFMALPHELKAALGLTGFSILVFLAGFASNFWFTSTGGSHFGLWAICSATVCVQYEAVLSATPVHAYVARFCTIYQLIAVIIGLVLLCIFLFKSMLPNIVKSSYSTILSAGVLGFLGAVIFIGREKSLDTRGTIMVSWGGIVVIFASIMQIAAATLIILSFRRGEVQFQQA